MPCFGEESPGSETGSSDASSKSETVGEVPSTFKTARKLPILKKPMLDSSDVNNYRLNQLHDSNQSGFKSAHSTETALLAVTEQ
ncbi:hypothetical protein SRHO_G00019850 [Serrasalmus rhombeus]